MSTKNLIIQRNYQEIRISGLTVNPRPSDDALALVRLEDMMWEYYGLWNLDVGYNFETVPNINAQTNVPNPYTSMMAYNLAVRMIPAFNKMVPQTLIGLSSSSFSSAIGTVALERLRQIQPPRTMPRGSGNTNQNLYWNRYFTPVPLPPTMPGNQTIIVGETQNYQVDFSAWLGSNTIASFQVDVDPLLTLDASANASPVITYRITATTGTGPTTGPWQLVKITVTDSIGRVEIRFVNFEVITPPQVP